jgi:branched-chain amino acid transport system substrate-binding protein
MKESRERRPGPLLRLGMRLGLLACSSVLFFPACFQSAAEEQVDTIKLGLFARSDGDFSDEANISLVLMALREINEAGGLTLDGKDYKLDLEIASFTDSSAKTASKAFDELVAAGVKGVLGPPWSSQLLGSVNAQDGVWRRAVEHEIVLISESATSSLITDLRDENYVFRVMPPDLIQAQVAAQEVFDRGHRRISILRRDDSYAQGLAKDFVLAFEKLGGTILAEQPYDTSGEDIADLSEYSYDGELDAVLAGAPDMIYMIVFDEVVQISQRMVERGELGADSDVQFFTADSVYNIGTLEACPAQFLARLAGTTPGVDEESADFGMFESALDSEGLGAPWNASAQLYDAVYLLALSMQAADSFEPTVYKEFVSRVSRADGGDVVVYGSDMLRAKEALAAGNDINYEGVSGPIELDEHGDPGAGTYLVWSVDVSQNAGVALTTEKLVPFELD